MRKLVCRPNTSCFDVFFSTFSVCIVRDAVLPGRLYQDPYVFFVHRIHKRERIPSVFCSKFCPPSVNPEFTVECTLIAHSDVINVLEETRSELSNIVV